MGVGGYRRRWVKFNAWMVIFTLGISNTGGLNSIGINDNSICPMNVSNAHVLFI